jgi:hypothetical protein
MKIIIFDVDETLGSFNEFYRYCSFVLKTHKQKLTYPRFRYLLDINPIFLRPNILNVLQFIQLLKHKCKVAMFTNNNGKQEWIQFIQCYFHEKLNCELFDKIVYAKQYEPKRKEETKSLQDFFACTRCNPQSEILFFDDQLHPMMLKKQVRYFHIQPYTTTSGIDDSFEFIQCIYDFLY